MSINSEPGASFVFLIFFWNMPSALVLYWLTNNILSIIQTLVIYRQNEK